jgi:very-short-patch-repair endonuclease
VLWDAGFVMPRVNWKLRGPRPDFWWPDQRFIIEIDGDQYHRFPDEDARIQAIWEAAGNTVKRIDSQDVYYRPERLIALAHQANVPFAPR